MLISPLPPSNRQSQSILSFSLLFVSLGLLALISFAVPALARTSAAAQLEKAREYYEIARKAHSELEQIPMASRKEADYARVIAAFRRVYLTSPHFGNDTICLMAIGELSEEAARLFQLPKYFYTAINAYQFLVREYPKSQFRFDAQLSIGRIYRDDLQENKKALEQYERYLKLYPRSAQAGDAQLAIARLRDETSSDVRIEAGSDQAAAQAAAEAAPQAPASAPTSPNAPTGSAALVSDIRYWATPGFSRVVIDVDRKVEFKVGRLPSPTRLYLDLQDARVIPPSGKILSVGDEMLKQVRVAQFKPGVARVVLDLGSVKDYEISELTNPYRLVIDVGGTSQAAGGAGGPANQRPEAQAVLAPASIKPAAPAASPATSKPAAAATAARAVEPDSIKPAQPIPGGSHSLTRALGLKVARILLDPGHGGHDTGTIGAGGLTEKELVLDLSQRLGKLIEERLGSEVLYTRDDDSFVSLEDRAAAANQLQADLFLSIHANSSRSKRATGVETYYLSLTEDAEALEVAARENAVSQETISELPGLVRKIALNEKVDESKEFATRIQSALSKGLGKGPGNNRGVKKAPFVVLIEPDMPSALAEVTFLSNPNEEKRLKTPEYRQKIAEALYKGVSGYVETMSGVRVAGSPNSQSASLD
jgi:N-acetylmuramoyl-L-alanine amidase